MVTKKKKNNFIINQSRTPNADHSIRQFPKWSGSKNCRRTKSNQTDRSKDNQGKTKYLDVLRGVRDKADLHVDGLVFQQVTNFKYLGINK